MKTYFVNYVHRHLIGDADGSGASAKPPLGSILAHAGVCASGFSEYFPEGFFFEYI